jgi:hypothetical protein
VPLHHSDSVDGLSIHPSTAPDGCSTEGCS